MPVNNLSPGNESNNKSIFCVNRYFGQVIRNLFDKFVDLETIRSIYVPSSVEK